jgi:RNA polymerase sigma-70 factor (ECF subfamily)
LLDRAKAGSAEAFETLADRYHPHVKRAAYRLTGDAHDAHDVAQHVLTQLFLNLAKFDDRRSLSAWVNTVVLRRCQDVRRERSLQSARRQSLEAERDAGGPEDVVVRRDLARRVRAVIATLPDDYRSVLEMRHFRALPFEEIAAELALPAKRIKALAWRAERRLRAELLDSGVDLEM